MATYTDPTTIIPAGSPKRLDTGPLLGLVAAALSVVLAASFWYLISSAKTQTANVQAQADAKQKQVNDLSSVSQQLVSLDAQAHQLHSVFDPQIPWNTVIDTFSAHLYKGLALTSFQFADTGAVTIKGYTPTYGDYAKLYQSMTDTEGQKYFSNVRPTSIEKTSNSNGTQVVNFVFSLSLTPDVLSGKITSATGGQ